MYSYLCRFLSFPSFFFCFLFPCFSFLAAHRVIIAFFKIFSSSVCSLIPPSLNPFLFFSSGFFLSWSRCHCDVTPSAPTLHHFFEPFHFLASDQLVVLIGASHISLPLQEIQSREWEKKEQTNNMLGLIQAQEGSYATLHFLCAYVD